MSQKPQSDDQKSILINRIYEALLSYVNTEQVVFKSDVSDVDKKKKLFIYALCTSCVGDMKNLYASFDDFINFDFKNTDIIKMLHPIIDELRSLDTRKKDFKKEKDIYEDKINRNNIICETVGQYLVQVNQEFDDLNTDPQFKEINQLVTKTRKRSDKAERINQMIIHDMIYLVDRLNRQITMSKANK